MRRNYDTDITVPTEDSLERVMSVIYSDIHHGSLKAQAGTAFRELLAVLNRRLAQTTNALRPTNQSPLYQLLCKSIHDGRVPRQETQAGRSESPGRSGTGQGRGRSARTPNVPQKSD